MQTWVAKSPEFQGAMDIAVEAFQETESITHDYAKFSKPLWDCHNKTRRHLLAAPSQHPAILANGVRQIARAVVDGDVELVKRTFISSRKPRNTW